MCLTGALFGVADMHNVKLSTCVGKWGTRLRLISGLDVCSAGCANVAGKDGGHECSGRRGIT